MKEMRELDNLSYAIFLEIAFQAFSKVDSTNYDMYNRKKFLCKIDKSYLILDDNSFWVSYGSHGRWELRGRLQFEFDAEILMGIF